MVFTRKFLVYALALITSLSGLAQAQEDTGTSADVNILRDVMQPTGVPVVSFYHTLRENIFLNARVIQAAPLERVGDIFLLPSHYLFAGKTISVDASEEWHCQIEQTFSYERLHWLKTLGSIVAMPVAEPLGLLFKGLSHLSPDVRKRHKAIKKALKAAQVHSHREEYLAKGISAFHLDQYIPCLHHKRPSSLTKKQKVEVEALKEIAALFEQHNILWWVDCGTCLGAYRYGGIIPWDWDIDVAILLPDHENVKKVLSKLDPEKYQIQDWSSYSKPGTFLKLYVKETKNFIDIYHYQFNEVERTIAYLFTYLDSPFPDSWKKAEMKCMQPLKYEQIFPLKKAHFDGLEVWAPHDTIGFLQSKYGSNLEPAMVWVEETKRYEKVADHPYWQE